METVGSESARRRLPELLDRAQRGEQTLIQRHGVPVAALVPLDQRQSRVSSLINLRGSGKGCWSGDAAEHVHALRDEWS
jgi:prevent-host-death family protein